MRLDNSVTDESQILSNLPPLPGILRELFEACELEESEAQKKIPQIIKKEPFLNEKILQFVNSSCFELPKKVDDISSAIAPIGVRAIKNAAVIAAVVHTYSKSIRDSLFNLKLFWWHAVKCAVIAILIAKKVGYRELHSAFTCGFLHDIGKLALLLNLPERHTRLESYSDQEALSLASEMYFGITHSNIGASLLHQWKLETFMADAVLYHHQPKERVIMALPLVKMVYVANGLSQASPEKQEEGCKTATEIFNFSKVDLEELLRQSDNQLQEMSVLLGAEIEEPRSLRKTISVNDLKTVQDSKRKLKAAGFLIKTLHSLSAASSQDAIFKQIRHALKKMFKVESGLIFLLDIERNELVGKIVRKDDKLSESEDLSVSLRAKESLLVKTLRHGKLHHSFRQPPESSHTIIDEQVIRFVGKEGILCLPLIAGGEHIGVIVIGLDKGELSRLSKHVDILTMLSNQAAVPFHRDVLKQQNLKKLKSRRIQEDDRRGEKRRRHTRKSCSLPVHYAVDELTFKDYVRDISEGGAFVQTTSSFLVVGEQIRLVFASRSPEEAIKVTAEVVWCRLDGIGVKFTKSSKNFQKMIRSL